MHENYEAVGAFCQDTLLVTATFEASHIQDLKYV